jgi:catabolite regulation protein CreA
LAFVFRLDQMSAKRKEFEKRAKDLIKPQWSLIFARARVFRIFDFRD